MAITVGTSEPTSFTVGDTVSWTRHEADYLPPTWNLVYGFSGPTRFTVTSTDSGTDHLATLPVTSGTILPGRYLWNVRATDGTNNITLQIGQMDARPNITAADAELDAAEASLAAVQAAYHLIAEGSHSSVSIDGVQYVLRNMTEHKAVLMFTRREVERIKANRRALLGLATGNLFLTRFMS